MHIIAKRQVGTKNYYSSSANYIVVVHDIVFEEKSWFSKSKWCVIMGEIPCRHQLQYMYKSKTYYNSKAEALNAYELDDPRISEATNDQLNTACMKRNAL